MSSLSLCPPYLIETSLNGLSIYKIVYNSLFSVIVVVLKTHCPLILLLPFSLKKVKLMVNPFAYEEYRKDRIRQKIEETRAQRVQLKVSIVLTRYRRGSWYPDAQEATLVWDGAGKGARLLEVEGDSS